MSGDAQFCSEVDNAAHLQFGVTFRKLLKSMHFVHARHLATGVH